MTLFSDAMLLARRTLLVLAAGSLLALVGCSEDRPKFNAIDITGAEYARDFQLTDHNGQPRSLKDFKGKVVVLFFGYTQCPDVCPTSMVELAEVKKLLGPQGDKLQGLFVTLDPERDKPEMLKAYMANFDPSFLALYTSVGKLPEVAKEFKIYYKKVDGPTPTSYTLDHSAGSYVFDPEGHVRLFMRFGSGAPAVAADIKQLLK
jgi:protein SCO1/2